MSGPTDQALADWVAEQQERAPNCACGCGQRIAIRAEHRERGVPRFILGHHNRVSARTKSSQLTVWVESERGKHLCACGCGQAIEIRRHHRKAGIPRYRYRHALKGSQNPRYLGVDAWVALNQGQHLCACGCGGTVAVLARHHWIGRIPQFIKGHHKHLKGPLNPKFVRDRASLKAGRGGRYFYNSLREDILRRDGFRCVACGSDDRVCVDHIIPVAEGGPAAISNGQSLCHACHVRKTRIDRARTRLRRLSDAVELKLFRLLSYLRNLVRGMEAPRGSHR